MLTKDIRNNKKKETYKVNLSPELTDTTGSFITSEFFKLMQSPNSLGLFKLCLHAESV